MMGITSSSTWKKLEARWDKGFDLLMPEEQEAIALWWLEAETMNGSLHQFFWNSSGDLALIALSGLKRLRMPITAKALESALQYFGDDYPINRSQRAEALKRIESQYGKEVFGPETNVIENLPERFLEAAVAKLEKIYSMNET